MGEQQVRGVAQHPMDDWPKIAPGVLAAPEAAQAAHLLWGVMTTDPPASGLCPIYYRFPAYLAQAECDRRRPVVDEMMGPPAGSAGPSVILRHDCDDARDLERWEEWESDLGLRSVTLLRSPVPPGGGAAADASPDYSVPPPNYDVEEKRIIRFVEQGRTRGCEFGLHYSSARPEVVRAEFERLQTATGIAPPCPASAHWLQSCGATIRTLDQLGVSHDLSFMDYASYAGKEIPQGVVAHPGFPTGTVHAHLLWDCLSRQWLRLVAIPGALEEEFVAGRCPTRPSPADIASYLDLFAYYRGVLVLNWHTETWELVSHLEGLVDELRARDFTFITPSQLQPHPPPRPDQIEIADPRVASCAGREQAS